MADTGIIQFLDKLSQNRITGKLVTSSSILFFLVFVLGPLFFIFTKLGQFKFLPEMESALFMSFYLAFTVTIIDLAFGIPLAWLLARKKFPFHDFIDALIDLPLVIPTSALGLSVALLWTTKGVDGGIAILVLLHIAFTFSYVVRTSQAAIAGVDSDLERAAKSLGANPFSVFRTVWLPLFRPGVVSGAILAFTRSLGETGATLMVAGALQTVPILTIFYKNSSPADMDAAISLSIILIALSAVLFLVARSTMLPARFRLGKIYAGPEKIISRLSPAGTFTGLAFFAIVVLLPSFYFLLFTDMNFLARDVVGAILVSLAIGTCATAISVVFGLPFAFYISSRSGLSWLFRMLNEMCMLMPTVTIGISLSLFWAGVLPEPVLLVLTSIAIIAPFFIGSVCEIIEGMDKNLADVARSLGSKPFGAFRNVVLPIIMPALIAGSVIAFMRSMAETGSTLAVSKTIVTIPILIVNLNKAGQNGKAASAAVLLLAISIVIVFMLRAVQKKKR